LEIEYIIYIFHYESTIKEYSIAIFPKLSCLLLLCHYYQHWKCLKFTLIRVGRPLSKEASDFCKQFLCYRRNPNDLYIEVKLSPFFTVKTLINLVFIIIYPWWYTYIQGWTRSGFFILRSRSRSLKKKFSRSDYRSNLRPKLRSNPDHRSDQK